MINIEPTERVARLKEKVVNAIPEISIERARIATEVYRRNEADPVVVRRGKVLKEVLKNIPIQIMDGELIVGNQAEKPRMAPIFPEYSWDWIMEELDDFANRPSDRFLISEESKRELREEILPYWQGRTVKDRVLATQPEDVLKERKVGVLGWEGNVTAGQGHIVVDFEMALKKGLRGVITDAEAEVKKLNMTDPDDLRKRPFLQAVVIALEGAINFGRRYSKLAREMAGKENDPVRKEELLSISDICRRVPEYPPRNFREAIQMIWFVQLILQIETNGHSVSLGRFDQYIYPYYKSDIERGILTREQAEELITLFYIKLFTINKVRPWSHTRFVSGYPTYQNLITGGQTVDGKDATNEVSHICLDALAKVRLSEPNFYVRYHDGLSEDFLRKCVEVIKLGFGMPALVNDKVIIPSLMDRGVIREDAMNYSTMGCLEVQVPGKWGYRENGKSKFNLIKILELALNDGRDPKTGIQLCKGDGSLTDFENFDQVMKAWKRQLHYYMELQVTADNINDLAMEEVAPDVFCCALVQDCIKRGKTIMEGGAIYDMISGCQVGAANVGNSLAAIKEAVFESKLITTKELKDALDSNFEGIQGERVRQLLINRTSKYGNDQDGVDLITKEAFDYYVKTISNYKNTRYGRGPKGGVFMPSTVTISANIPCGLVTGATPDGRKAGEPATDGVSPMHNTEKSGPTAVIKSVTKLSTRLMTGGQLLNMRFNASMLETEEQREKFLSLIKTFFARQGWHVQFNTISTEILKDAQSHPEKYRDLTIRVAGYSALFISLDKTVQDDIINRMEYAF